MSDPLAPPSLRALPAPELSIVVPFFNEEGAAGALLAEIGERLAEAMISRYEILAVDDGSTDATGRILATAAERDRRVVCIGVERNSGQAAALLRGFQLARAPILVTLDGDGQNDPVGIPALLARLDGADPVDLVVGYRHPRNDSWLRRKMSRVANAVRGRILHDGVRDSGCALKAMRREVVQAFPPLRTLYSFMPALAVGAGYRVAEIPVRHRPRTSGKSSYGFRQFWWRPLVDLCGVWWFNQRRIPVASLAPLAVRRARGAADEDARSEGHPERESEAVAVGPDGGGDRPGPRQGALG